MLAVKAEYDNGQVRWHRKPSVSGRHPLRIVFVDIEECSDRTAEESGGLLEEKKKMAISSMRGICTNLPKGVSMADELIEERRRDAERGE